MKYLLIIFFLVTFPGTGSATDISLTSDPVLNRYVIEGLAKSPRIATARYQGIQAMAGIAAAGALPDPKLSFVFNNYPVDSFAGDESPMTGKILKLSQAFPYPGKLAAKESAAESRSAAMAARVLEEGLVLRRDLVWAWSDLQLRSEVTGITEKKLRALDDFQRFIETRYAVGKSGQQDVLNVQVSLTETLNGLSEIKRQVKGALYEFNRLLHRPSEVPVDDLPRLTVSPYPAISAGSLADIETNRPLFTLLRTRIAENQHRVTLAKLQSRPDFNIGAGYTYREESPSYDSTDFISVEFGMTLPFVNRSRINSEKIQANAALQAAHSDYRNLLANEQMKVNDLQQQLRQLEERTTYYKDGILPQAKQSYEASLAAYQVGRYDLSALLKNLLGIYSAEIEHLRAMADFNKTVAELRYRTGIDSARISAYLNTPPALSVMPQ